MKLIYTIAFFIFALIMTMNATANNMKPGFIVTPFSRSVTLAANSTADVLVVAQNQTTVNQTITNIAPQIPAESGITSSITINTCGLLVPGASCGAVVKLQSSKKPSTGQLNVSICSFNGAFCSRIIRPIDFNNTTPVGIYVTPTTPTIAKGTTKQFNAIGLFANTTYQDVTDSVTWHSSDPTKATISNASGTHGLATGIAGGVSTISATLEGATGSTSLTVTTATLTSITITPVNPTIANGRTEAFTATGIYSDNSNQDLTADVTWTSSNEAVATISNSPGTKGTATAKSAGQTNIHATLGAVSGSTTLHVSAATLTSISVTPTNPSTSIYTIEPFTATGLYSDNTVKDLTDDVTWSTQSTLIAIISNHADSKGTALGVGVGTTPIYATLGGVVGSTNIDVTDAILTGINISPTNVSLPAGSEQAFTATGIYNNGRTQDITTKVTWQSSNIAIATISNALESQGLAKGIQSGGVVISATLDGVIDSTDLNVTTPTLVSINVTPAGSTIANGTKQQFTATGLYSDASTQDITDSVTWTSSTPSVAIISNADDTEGLATTLAAGSTTIAATLNGISGNTTLTVSAAVLTSIAVTPANTSIPNATTSPFTATGTYSDLSTKIITNDVTWRSSNNAIASVSNAELTKGLVTGVEQGSTNISATQNAVVGSTPLTVIGLSIGDSFNGGKVACLGGGLNNLITANTNNSTGIIWGGTGTTTNAQSDIDGAGNTARIVGILGAGTSYAAGLCNAYEIDSAGNTPCIGGNTCYNDWFLPSINQLTCLRNNRNQIKDFTRAGYWSSTESSTQSKSRAWFITFENSGQPAATADKTETYYVRCVRALNATP